MPRTLSLLSVTFLLAASLGACTTTAKGQPELRLAPTDIPETQAGFEQPAYVLASDFIPDALMRGDDYIIARDAYNDGYAVSYKIATKKDVFVVQGTDKALQTIKEIDAIKRLKDYGTAEVIGETVVGKVNNLIATPKRVIESGIKRFKEADSATDALMVIPSGMGGVLKNVGEGLYEVGKTGAAITQEGFEQSGFKYNESCANNNCYGDTSIAAKKGAEELSGAATNMRALHKALGTDPYSDNAALQNEVRRIAYSKTISGLSLTAGLSVAGLPPAIGIYNSGVNAVNRAEDLIDYSDPYERREAEKGVIRTWRHTKTGKTVNMDSHIESFYSNSIYTPTTRTQLLNILERVPSRDARRDLFIKAADAKTPYVAETNLKSMRYLSEKLSSSDSLQIIRDLPFAAYRGDGNDVILILSADHLLWTPDLQTALKTSAAKSKDRFFEDITLIVIGQASKAAQREIKNMDIAVKTIAPAPYSVYGG